MAERASSPTLSFSSAKTAQAIATSTDEAHEEKLVDVELPSSSRPSTRQTTRTPDFVELDMTPHSPTPSGQPILPLSKTISHGSQASHYTGRTSRTAKDIEQGQPDEPSSPYRALRADSSYDDGDEGDTVSLKEGVAAGRAGSIAIAGEGLGITTTYPPSVKKDDHSASTSTVGGETLIAPPPDGGWRAWATVFGGFLTLTVSFGYVNAWGVYQSYYKQTIFSDRSESAISWIGSVQLCLFFLCALIAGPMFDKGRFRLLVGLGSAIWVVSILITPQATKYWHAMLIQGVMAGFGTGLLFLPALSVQSHWFEKKRNLAVGIVASGSSIGGIAFPIMLNKLFNNPDYGFAKGVRAAGYVVLACLVVANICMSPNPARKGLKKPKPAPLKQLFSLPYSCLAFGAMILNFGLWMPNFYIQVYAEAKGVDSNLAFYTLAIFNAGSFIGRTVPNLIADKTGPFLVQSLCCLCAGILLFFMHIMTSPAAIVIFAALYGGFSGGFISLVSPVIVSMSKDLSEIGLRQGIAFLIVAGAAVGCNPIAGKLFANNNNDFLYPILFAAIMATAGSLVIGAGCIILMKRKGTWRV
ncbi:hypothetical protein JCM8547_004337 [Rhodosporidiobolus lusitaniae]